MLFINFVFLLGFGNDTLPNAPVVDGIESIFWEREAMDFSEGNIPFDGTLFPFESMSDSMTGYDAEKASIIQIRKQLIEDLDRKKISIDEVKASFNDHLVNRLIPHWYGTKWSFGGHTAIPKQGKIACGYFVSTTLRDMGLRLNRYHMAQKLPLDEAKMISCGAEIKTVSADDAATAIQEIDALTRDGISFIGFDEGHVGFLLKKEGKLFLLHSNYLFPNAVCLEPIEESHVFKTFSTFHLVDISNNDQLIQRWLADAEIL